MGDKYQLVLEMTSGFIFSCVLRLRFFFFECTGRTSYPYKRKESIFPSECEMKKIIQNKTYFAVQQQTLLGECSIN